MMAAIARATAAGTAIRSTRTIRLWRAAIAKRASIPAWRAGFWNEVMGPFYPDTAGPPSSRVAVRKAALLLPRLRHADFCEFPSGAGPKQDRVPQSRLTNGQKHPRLPSPKDRVSPGLAGTRSTLAPVRAGPRARALRRGVREEHANGGRRRRHRPAGLRSRPARPNRSIAVASTDRR